MSINNIYSARQVASPNTERFDPLNPNKRKNSHGLTGMYKGGRKAEIVDLPDEIEGKVVDLAQSEFLNNYGKSDGEELSGIIANYLKNTPENNRLNVSHTLSQTYLQEARRIKDIMQEHYPAWQEGEPFDREAIAKLITANRLDIQV